MSKTIVGWVLVALGLGLILWGVWDSYQIFTAQKPVPAIFPYTQAPVVNSNSDSLGPSPTNPEEQQKQLQDQMAKNLQEQLGKMLPSDALPKILNLMCWSIFIGICVFAGGRISGIGVSLLKAENKT